MKTALFQIRYLRGTAARRRGELLGLRRRNVDLLHGTLAVAQIRTLTMAGAMLDKVPKSETGARTIAIPANVLPVLGEHLERFTATDPEAFVLVGEKGGPLRPQVRETAWQRARASIGRPELRLHDLRHSGLTWAAATGASIAELMRRAGHPSPAAALRYQHATDDRDRPSQMLSPVSSALRPSFRSGWRRRVPAADAGISQTCRGQLQRLRPERPYETRERATGIEPA